MKENNVNKNVLRNCRRVFGLVWKYDRKTVTAIYTLSFLAIIVDVFVIYLSSLFINAVTTRTITTIFDREILFLFGLFIIFPILASSFWWWNSYHYNKLSMLFNQYFTDSILLNKKVEVDIQILENSKFASLSERVNSNTFKVFMIWEDIYQVFIALTGLVISSAVFIFYRWWFMLILLIAVLPDLYLEIKYGKNKWGIWNLDAETRKRYWETKGYFQVLSTILDIKLYNVAEYFKSRVSELISGFNDSVVALEKSRTRKRDFARMFLFIVAAVLTLVMMNDVIVGSLLIGTFAFYLNRLANFRNNLVNLFRYFGMIASDNPFINDAFEFLDTKKVIKNGKVKLEVGTPRVEFKNVSFKYPETEKFILEDLNLVIEPGEKVAIVGVNGAGKTTFTKTLMRFYDVTTGEILIDGKNIKDVDINTFYEKLGYLPQDYARYRLTIAEAISISDPYRKTSGTSPSPEGRGPGWGLTEIIEASKKAGSHEFIMGPEKGYDTQLGKEFEGGVEPSVGQWQKLALARLFYKNPQVWILDEPTASIDAVAEIEIFNELEKLPKDKTVILISHRFNTVKNADKIIVIEHGKIAEMGSHDELMSISEGHYKNLFNSQKDSYN